MTSAPSHVEDFDAFWNSDRKLVKIRGQLVPIPVDLPFETVAAISGTRADDEGGVKDLLAEIYSADIVEAWSTAGMGVRESFIVLTWSFMRGTGAEATFEEAAEAAGQVLAQIAEANAPTADGKGARGKAPARSRTSAGTGASSSRTSAGSTGSRRKTSAR